MSLRDLNYLIAVADEQSFVRAAERCCVSQPALSMQIKKLETSLGVAIFDRSHRRIQCTPVGARLIAKARLVLAQLDEFYAIANDREKSSDNVRTHDILHEETIRTS